MDSEVMTLLLDHVLETQRQSMQDIEAAPGGDVLDVQHIEQIKRKNR